MGGETQMNADTLNAVASLVGTFSLVVVLLLVLFFLTGCSAPDYRVEVDAADSVEWQGHFGKAVTPYPREGNGSASYDVTLGGERGERGANVQLLTPGSLTVTLLKAHGGARGIVDTGFDIIAVDEVHEAGKVAKVWGQ